MKPLLIVQADDAGIHPAIDRGILLAIDRGPVTSVGVVASGPTATDLAPELEKRPHVGVGLHLALTRAPALASTRLAFQGDPLPKSWRTLAGRLARRAVRQEDVITELRAQIQRAKRLALRIDHVTAHQHVHLIPGIADTIARLVRAEGLPLSSRISRSPRGEMMRSRRAVALAAASIFSKKTAWRHASSPDCVVGIADKGPENLLRLLAAVRPEARSIELIVHPGDRPMPGEPTPPDWGFDFAGELETLTKPSWRSVLAHDYLLGTYRDLERRA